MRKIILYISFVGTIFFLSFFLEVSSAFAKEAGSVGWVTRPTESSGRERSSPSISESTCTERCHVNYMAYENKFEVTQRAEVFRHKTHSFEQGLDCTSCHDNSEVNTEEHGKLTIQKENCLKCHHVELEKSECKQCHQNIDDNPMEYKKEKFIHGFTVKSDVDCGLCHVKDPNASLTNKEINCVKCHHTTPDLDCATCHKDDLDRFINSDSQRMDTLSWTESFSHSQHPKQDLSCRECHSISHENDAGIVEYNLNCSKCHHDSEEMPECIECHNKPSEYLRGKTGVEGIKSVPDMMSRAVKCEDCHKYNDEKLKFRGVEEYCIKCHNEDYGKLYNAWTETIESRLKKLNLRVQSLVEDGINEDKNGKAEERVDMDSFLDKTGQAVGIITKYGTHNFQLTRSLLDSLEEKIKHKRSDDVEVLPYSPQDFN